MQRQATLPGRPGHNTKYYMYLLNYNVRRSLNNLSSEDFVLGVVPDIEISLSGARRVSQDFKERQRRRRRVHVRRVKMEK